MFLLRGMNKVFFKVVGVIILLGVQMPVQAENHFRQYSPKVDACGVQLDPLTCTNTISDVTEPDQGRFSYRNVYPGEENRCDYTANALGDTVTVKKGPNPCALHLYDNEADAPVQFSFEPDDNFELSLKVARVSHGDNFYAHAIISDSSAEQDRMFAWVLYYDIAYVANYAQPIGRVTEKSLQDYRLVKEGTTMYYYENGALISSRELVITSSFNGVFELYVQNGGIEIRDLTFTVN